MKTILKTGGLAILLLLLTAIPTWANQGVGSSPYTADLLVSGLNTGALDPGQEYWYAYSLLDLGDAEYNTIMLSLNFEAEGRAVASRVNFQVFDFEQVESWMRDTSGPVDSLGLGTPASADFDVNTGERFWAGVIVPKKVYYVRIFNLSPSPVQYRLTALGQKSNQLPAVEQTTETGERPEIIPAAMNSGPTATPEETAPAVAAAPASASRSIADSMPVQPDDMSVDTAWLLAAQAIQDLPPQEAAIWLMSAAQLGWLSISPAMPVDPNQEMARSVEGGDDQPGGVGGAAVPADPNDGSSIYPNQPLQLVNGANIGRLAPQAEQWYTFRAGQVNDELIDNLSLTMFFTPGEPNIARTVTFEMFTADQYQIWERGTPQDMDHFGAGSWVSRDWDYNTGERLWHGTVVDGDYYYVKVVNKSEEWIDYHLFTDDIINTELGPPTVGPAEPIMPQPTPGADIGSPLPIKSGHTSGQLQPKEDIWYSFQYTDYSDDFEFKNHVIRLEHTPGAGYVTNHVNVEIYPYQMQHIWQRGTTAQIKPLGAGSDFKYEESTDTHTWLWNGHFVSNTIYFIRIRNDSIRPIAYDLFITGYNE